jgi:hypothetical protein
MTEANKLDTIFTQEQWASVQKFVQKKDVGGLRHYLSTIKKDLLEKEILDEYIFYVICHKFNIYC